MLAGKRSAFILNAESHGHSVHHPDRASALLAARHFRLQPAPIAMKRPAPLRRLVVWALTRTMNTNPLSLTRRRALFGLAAAAVPSIIPSRLLGRGAPSGKIHLAMIGTGRQAYHTNLPTLLGMPDVRVVAVCDVDRHRAAATKAKVDEHYGNTDCRLFTDFREALEMPDLNAVMNSTPDHWHAIISLAAIAKGLHVSCEKPLTRYLTEGRILADAARKKGVVFRTDTECRSHSYMTKTADLAINGYLGKIKRFEVGVPKEVAGNPGNPAPMPVPAHLDYEMWLGPAPYREYTRDRVHPDDLAGRPGWMRILDYCEGMVSNWGTHLIDVASLINGTERSGPVSIEGSGRYPEPGSGLWNTLLEFQVQYVYADGVTLDYKMDVPYLRVEGDEGWIQAHWNSAGGFKASDPKILRTVFRASDKRVPTRGDKADFVSAIKNGTPVMADAEIGHRTCSMGQLGHIAIQRGRRLEWNPETERFTNDDEANKRLTGTYRDPWKL
jgi:predicted dehydrogenase